MPQSRITMKTELCDRASGFSFGEPIRDTKNRFVLDSRLCDSHQEIVRELPF
jgi:hypothetical protein